MDQARQTFDDRAADGSRAIYGDSTASARGASAEDGVGTLITGLIGDLQELVRGEVRLAKAELRDDAKTIGSGIAVLAVGAFLALIGLAFLLLAVANFLDEETDLSRWQAVGIVALVVLALGAILALVGKNRLSASNLKPEQTIQSLKEDKEWAKQQINSVKK